MKKAIYLIGILSLFAFVPSQEKQATEFDLPGGVNGVSQCEDETNFDLNGTWGLTNYFDSICEKKELARFRLQIPTWFAILLKIENDTLKSFGSIDNDQYLIEKANDTLTVLTSQVSGDTWYLIAKNPYLKLIQCPNQQRIDSTVYIFRKRDDLSYFASEKKGGFTIGKNVTNYFNEQLFAGTYVKMDTKQELVFGKEGKITGLHGFDSYAVRNYFGTLHPHKNLDVITFSNSQTNEIKQYHWTFSNDELLLTEFVYEKVIFQGETYDGDDMVLGEEKIKLKITSPKK